MVYRKQSVKLGNWLDLLTRVNDVNGKQEQEKNVTGHDINLESKCFNVNKNRGENPQRKAATYWNSSGTHSSLVNLVDHTNIKTFTRE